MNRQGLETTPPDQWRPACHKARLLAWLLDVSVAICGATAVAVWAAGDQITELFIANASGYQLAGILAVPAIVNGMLLATTQKSAGLAAMELMMVCNDGESLSASNIVRRLAALPVVLVTGGVLGLLPLFSNNRRTVGDFISGTRIVEQPRFGRRIAFDSWRIFQCHFRWVVPICLVVFIGAGILLDSKSTNKEAMMNGSLVALVVGSIASIIVAVFLVRSTRVVLTETGVVRSGLFGWQRRVITWDQFHTVRINPGRVCSYLGVDLVDRRRLRIPLETATAKATVLNLQQKGVTIQF